MPLEVSNKSRNYNTTGKTVYSCHYHVVWCPKYRRSVLTAGIQARLKELINEKQDEYQYEILEIETMPDHVHLLVDIPTNHSVDSTIGKIKGYTSKVLREEFPDLKRKLPTLWTRSKFVSSCGGVTLAVLKEYINEQKGE